MKELIFQVEFVSDIVLPASSNTEGNIQQLDFIAGSNFLGMVAREYDKFKDSFAIFHSGKVRFGDGNILTDKKQPTYKIPYSYFHKKLEPRPIYNQHLLDDEDFKVLGQLKQLRNGYITEEKEEVSIDYTYSQKSAYDKTKRTSKEGKMYGYKALKKKTLWQFVVKIDDAISSEDEKLIIDTLKTSKRLGKSKSTEYGQVQITYIKSEVKDSQNFANKDRETILYCNSRLALVDEGGNPTYDLTHLCNDLEIVYEKTQIRTSAFTPYNRTMQTKSYERLVIDKGSVIVVENVSKEQLETIHKGVGAYLSEGFGEILIDPSFLLEREFLFTKECKEEEKANKRVKLNLVTDDTTIEFLVNRHNTNIDMLDIANEVAEFISSHKKSTFGNIKPSQWGNIRSIASGNQNDFIQKIKTYISGGNKKWEAKQVQTLVETINNHTIDKQQFIKLLAMKMGGKND